MDYYYFDRNNKKGTFLESGKFYFWFYVTKMSGYVLHIAQPKWTKASSVVV